MLLLQLELLLLLLLLVHTQSERLEQGGRAGGIETRRRERPLIVGMVCSDRKIVW